MAINTEDKLVTLKALKALKDYAMTEEDIANNLSTTVAGQVLDARQGKILNDRISALRASDVGALATTGGTVTGQTNFNNGSGNGVSIFKDGEGGTILLYSQDGHCFEIDGAGENRIRLHNNRTRTQFGESLRVIQWDCSTGVLSVQKIEASGSIETTDVFKRSTTIDYSMNPSSDVIVTPLSVTDKDGNMRHSIYTGLRSDGSVTSTIQSRTYVNSEWKANGITVGVHSDGSRYYGVSDTAAFRNAIGASSGTWPISLGGTGATTAAAARTNLGAMADGTVSISKGGTGATTAAAALTNLGALPLSGGTVTGQLILSKGTDIAPDTASEGALVIGNKNGLHIAFDNNEILAKSNATTLSDLFLNTIHVTPEGNVSATTYTGTWNGNAISINKGGTGATTATAARTNLGITPANIGAMPDSTVPINKGGTGATTAAAARTNLGITLANLGAMADSTVPINKGGTGATSAADARSNLGITPANIGAMPDSTVPINKGGTGATTAAAARTNLGAMADSTVPINKGGTGATTAAAARTNLGAMADSTVPINKGGTGATSAADARSNLGITPANIGALSLSGGTVTGQLILSKTTDVSGNASSEGALVIGTKTGSHLAFDPNEIIAKSNATTKTNLTLNERLVITAAGAISLQVPGNPNPVLRTLIDADGTQYLDSISTNITRSLTAADWATIYNKLNSLRLLGVAFIRLTDYEAAALTKNVVNTYLIGTVTKLGDNNDYSFDMHTFNGQNQYTWRVRGLSSSGLSDSSVTVFKRTVTSTTSS